MEIHKNLLEGKLRIQPSLGSSGSSYLFCCSSRAALARFREKVALSPYRTLSRQRGTSGQNGIVTCRLVGLTREGFAGLHAMHNAQRLIRRYSEDHRGQPARDAGRRREAGRAGDVERKQSAPDGCAYRQFECAVGRHGRQHR